MASFHLVSNKQELIENCIRFAAFRNSQSPAEQEFFEDRIKNIKRFVALSQPNGSYIFAPGAYVAYDGSPTLEAWKELGDKGYRQGGRNHLDKLLRQSLIDEGHPFYEQLKQAFQIFCGSIEPSSGDVDPLRFWLLDPIDDGIPLAGGDEWSDQELYAAVSAYLQMLALEQKNEHYSKKFFNDALRAGELKHRTASSVEYRMQNISAILEELCLPRISGYRPAKNVGEKTKNKIKKILESQGYVSANLYEPVEDGAELQRRVAFIQKRFVPGTPKGNLAPQRSSTVREVFQRDALVIAYVLAIAGDVCECCGLKAPFKRSDGSPYLEVHHVRTLADGGSDHISNAVAICPNCHRSLHFAVDREQQRANLYQKVRRLISED